MRPAGKQKDASSPALVTREFLLSFWKIHILHHAGEGSVYGQWIAEELRRHGYRISPGTLYPLLRRMEANGWLKNTAAAARFRAPRRKEYRLTKAGAALLVFLRAQVEELHHEVMEARKQGKHR